MKKEQTKQIVINLYNTLDECLNNVITKEIVSIFLIDIINNLISNNKPFNRNSFQSTYIPVGAWFGFHGINWLYIFSQIIIIPFSFKAGTSTFHGGFCYTTDKDCTEVEFDIPISFLSEYKKEIYDAVILNFEENKPAILNFANDILIYTTNENQTK